MLFGSVAVKEPTFLTIPYPVIRKIHPKGFRALGQVVRGSLCTLAVLLILNSIGAATTCKRMAMVVCDAKVTPRAFEVRR